MPKRTWTDEQLVEAVAVSTSMSQVMRHLGIRPGRYDYMRGHIRRLGVDASHIRAMEGSSSRRPRTWRDDELPDVVASSQSYAEVMRTLGYEPSGGLHRWLKALIRDQGISTAHFTGQAWRKGRKFQSSPRRSLQELLVAGSVVSSGTLRAKLITAGIRPAWCEICGLNSWRGERLPLMLDHINGDPMDNRLENLRILCPNCHSLTPTWCGRKRKLTPA